MSQEEQEQKQRFCFNWSLTLKTKSGFILYSALQLRNPCSNVVFTGVTIDHCLYCTRHYWHISSFVLASVHLYLAKPSVAYRQ